MTSLAGDLNICKDASKENFKEIENIRNLTSELAKRGRELECEKVKVSKFSNDLKEIQVI